MYDDDIGLCISEYMQHYNPNVLEKFLGHMFHALTEFQELDRM